MENIHVGRLTELFFPSLVTIALFASIAAFEILGPVVGIKSGYVLIGLLLAVTLYNYAESDSKQLLEKTPPNEDSHLSEFVIGLALMSIIAVVGARAFAVDASVLRTAALVVVLPVGYLLLALQIQRGVANKWLLLQIICLYAVDPLTKYASTNFYFGRGDIPKHVYFTELVVNSGTWQSIPETTFYSYFPGLQTLAGSVSLLTGLSPYDSLILTGIATYVIVVCVAYLLADLLFSDRLFPIYAAISVTALAPIHRYSVYFYPQALAVALMLIVVLVAFRYGVVQSSNYLQHALISAPIVMALWYTHHFTIVLFLPILVGLVLGPILLSRPLGLSDTVRPQRLPLLGLVGGSLTYWLTEDIFITALLNDLSKVVGFAEIPSNSGGGSEIVALGTAVPEPSVWEAALSLFSAGGLYNIMLVCLLSLGSLVVIRDRFKYQRAGTVIAIGIFGAGLMIRTPIDIHGLVRTQLPLSVFVAFVIAAGLRRLLPVRKESLKKAATVSLVVVLLASTGPAVAADDLYGLHSGPDLWESRTTPETQKDFTAKEMAGFRQSTAFSNRYDVSVATDWNSQIGLIRYSEEFKSYPTFDVDDGRIETNQKLLYRQRWLDHSIRLIPERLSFVTLLISDDWHSELIRNENKIYTTREVGMLADNRNASYLSEP